jgi:methionyl-tRNA formyltransferase
VKVLAEEAGIPVLTPERLRGSAFLSALRELHPDLCTVVAFRILPKEVLGIPPKGTVNVHPSLLPRYRGAAPIQWAVINGDRTTGVTTFCIQPEVDAGDILLQRSIEIGEEETAGEVHDRLKELGADLLLETLDLIESGRARPLPQPAEGVSKAPKLSKEDARIAWSEPAETIRNLIRGTNPIPGAYTFWRGAMLKVHRSRALPDGSTGQAGEVLQVDKMTGLVVATGRGRLLLSEVQLEGRRPMDSAAFVRGYQVEAGEILGEEH